MIGTIRWNMIAGGICFIFTFTRSISYNLFSTAIIHSCLGGCIMFLLSFLFRWLIGFVLLSGSTDKSFVGSQVNYITPDESNEIQQLIRGEKGNASTDSSLSESFEPLNPPKLISKNNLDPAEMAQALRQMSEGKDGDQS